MKISLKPLSQQTMVVTGASSGIGLATALRAAEAGANLVLVARNEEALKDAAARVEAAGGRAAYIAVDIAEDGAAERIGTKAEEAFGGFDTWVNNAAAAVYARMADMTMEEHRKLFDTGYFGTVAASLYAAKKLRGRGGAIINVGSILSERAIPIQGGYSAMKHAVLGFTDVLRMELEEEDAPVSVTLIKPASINTPYPEHARNKMDKPARVPPVLYDPRLVAKAICFAAEHPKRSLTVGGNGFAITKFGNAAPRLTDRIMEALFMEKGQSTDQPPAPGTRDNLFEARRDGRIESNQDVYVRRQSMALEAQMHPWRTAGILGAAGLAAGALWFKLGNKNESDGTGKTSGRTGNTERRTFTPAPPARAHQPDGTDSSASFAAGIADEATIPDELPRDVPAASQTAKRS
jgi:short-subunit dehydrogenase|tara:strand:- start:16332 stop:17552 length:1221 start_codon:yes stop_codon:yes gene_type:complete